MSTKAGAITVLVILLAALGGNAYLGLHDEVRTSGLIRQLRGDEHATKVQAEHTAAVQKAGAPTGVCLREAMKAGLPVLITVADDIEAALKKSPAKPAAAALAEVDVFLRLTRLVEAPLKEYVTLQEARYVGVECPKPKRR